MTVRKHAALFVLVIIFLDAVGFGLAMPVLPRLLMRVGHTDLSGAAAIYGWMALLYAVAQFFFGPVIGNLSDRFGRRPVLLGAMAGLAADYVLLAVANTLPLFFLGRAISGLLGGSYGPAQAALADTAGPDERARLFGMVGAAFGVGFVIGPAIGGLLGQLGDRVPFAAAAALSGINLLYGLTVFPETLAHQDRRPFDWRRANPLGAIGAARLLPGMTRVAIVLFVWQVASLVYPLTWRYYGIARFGWSNAMIGASLAVVGVVMALSQMFLTGRIVKRFGERRSAVIGMVGATVGFIGFAFATQTWMAFAVLVFLAIQAMTQPSLMAMMSRRGTARTQGEVQGIAAMAMGSGSIAGPLLLNPALAYFTSSAAPFRFAGAAFIISAGLTVVAIGVLVTTPRTESAA